MKCLPRQRIPARVRIGAKISGSCAGQRAAEKEKGRERDSGAPSSAEQENHGRKRRREKRSEKEQEEAVHAEVPGSHGEKLHISCSEKTEARQRIKQEDNEEETPKKNRSQEKASGEQKQKNQQVRDFSREEVGDGGSAQKNQDDCFRNGE